MALPFDHKHHEEIAGHARSFIDELKVIHAKDGLKELMNTIYSMTDQIHKEMTDSISCSKGCSFCCHDTIEISDWEAELIINEIKDYSPDMELLKKQNSVKDLTELSWHNQRCSLLSSDGTCSVYEKRPLICRTHNSTEEPSKCHLGNNPTGGHGQMFTVPTRALQYAMVLATSGKVHNLHQVLYKAKQQS